MLKDNGINRATIIKAGTDQVAFAVQDCEWLGKQGKTELIFPYGLHANCSVGTYLIKFRVNGQEENRVAIGGTPDLRPSKAGDGIPLKEGEVVLYHPLKQAKVFFDYLGNIRITTDLSNGAIQIDSPIKVHVIAPEVIVDATKTCVVNCPDTTLNSDKVTINGSQVTVNANLTVNGNVALSGAATSNGKNISNSHSHLNSGGPGQGGPVA